jgi:Tfp pilus assembly protein PilN
MKAVNLLPPERRQAGPASPLVPLLRRPLFVGASAALAVLAVGLALVAHSATSSVAQKRRQLTDVQTQLALSRPSKQPVSAAALRTASTRRAAVVGIVQRRVGWDAFLGALSRVIPEDVSLVSLTASPSGATATAAAPPSSTTGSAPAAAASPTTPFAIQGYAYSQAAVARLLDRLALVRGLTQIQLVGDSLTPIGNRAMFQCSVGASMSTTGGVS